MRLFSLPSQLTIVVVGYRVTSCFEGENINVNRFTNVGNVIGITYIDKKQIGEQCLFSLLFLYIINVLLYDMVCYYQSSIS